MSKKRRVKIDIGFETNELWVEALVIDSRWCQTLFGDEYKESLLVEIPGQERFWVGYWKEL